MKVGFLAATALVVLASPVLAAGIDSRRSPFPASVYSGYVDPSRQQVTANDNQVTGSAYRYSGPYAGGPANALPRR